MSFYYYGMRLRGYSPMCQPDGVIAVCDGGKQYHDIIVYAKKLTKEQEKHFSLDLVRVEQQ